MGTTGSRCHSLRALIPLMILLCPAGFATRHAINIGVHSYWRILPASSATRIASKCGPILEMVIFVALLEILIAEALDIFSTASPVVKVMLLIIVIQVTIILNLDAIIVFHSLFQNVLRAI
jgi:hypothetical protein